MYKGATKATIALLLAAMSGFCSCNSGKSEDQTKAEEILATAQELYDEKHYDNAVIMLDSLMKAYPGVIEAQRNAMHLRTLVVEQQTLLDSIANDSVILANKATVDSLARKFKYVKEKDMVEGYYVVASISGNNLTQRTDIEARIDEQGNLYLVSCLYGHDAKHTKLLAKSTAGEAQTNNVAFDNARNYRFKDGNTPVEMVTFRKEDCDSFCCFIAENADKNISLLFSGSKTHRMAMPAKTKAAIATTYRYATQKAKLKEAEDLKLFYEKKLQITRKQSRQTATNIKGNADS